MRAILLATGAFSRLGSLTEQFAAAMLPIVDRPFLQHILESLAGNGFSDFDVVVGDYGHQIEEHFGTGTRWGVTIRYHIARDETKPYRNLLTLSPLLDDTPVLVCHADRLPHLGTIDRLDTLQTPLLYSSNDGQDKAWTGCAWIRSKDLANMPSHVDEIGFERHLRHNDFVDMNIAPPLSIQRIDDFFKSNLTSISDAGRALIFAGREVEPGIWLSRNVVLHPTARINAPVYLSEDCRIGEGVELGPNVIVGPGCVLDRRCLVTNSIVLSSTYVGQGLELRDMIIVRDSLINARTGVEVTLDDDCLLSSVTSRVIRSRFARLVSCAAAFGSLVLVSPILLAIAMILKLFRGGPVFAFDEVVHVPAPPQRDRWKTYRLWRFNVVTHVEGLSRARLNLNDLLFRFLPGLANVARGDLRFVGVAPRTVAKMSVLSNDGRSLYLHAKAGLITETTLLETERLISEEYPISDAYYAVAGGLLHDSRLVIRYLALTLCGWTFKTATKPIKKPREENLITTIPSREHHSAGSVVG